MTLASPKGYLAVNAYPKTISGITVSVGALAFFLFFGSWVLVSFPISSTVRGYFYDIGRSTKLDLSIISVNVTAVDTHVDVVDKNVSSESSFQVTPVDKKLDSNSSLKVPLPSNGSGISSETKTMENMPASSTSSSGQLSASVTKDTSDKLVLPISSAGSSLDFNKVLDNWTHNSNSQPPLNYASPSIASDNIKVKDLAPSFLEQSSSIAKDGISTAGATPTSSTGSPRASDVNKTSSVYSGCDLHHGSWIYDSSGPLYTNNSCPVLTQMQNCQGNGRPDKDYENWRWKPFQCNLPRFDARKFLELMRGKTIAFVGDSVARNQMESLLCILWQVEVPKNRGNRHMQRYFFSSTSVMVVRIWSSWLVKQTTDTFDFAPKGVDKLHLDAPDDRLMEHIPKFDVVILSSGHWFAKQSVYILNNEIVGGQLWWPDKSRPMKINNIEAFGISVETIFSFLGTHPNYTGITILRTYSPDHYEGGAWNTGGSCTGKVMPLATGEKVENGFTKIMHEKQVTGFNNAIKKVTNKSKMVLMDITDAFEYRHDGHPGPYRSRDPNKLTQRGRDGRPPPQDCLHWCMPGPIDIWNEFVLEIIRREYEGNISSSS